MLRYHTPIMVEEVLGFLEPSPGRIYLDGTVGTGGHAEAILEKSAPTGRVVGIDADPESLELARQRLSRYRDRLLLVHGRYEHARQILSREGVSRVHGVLLDLGISRAQLEMPGRGFSFARQDPLDMRLDRTSGITAEEYLQGLSEEELVEMLRRCGEIRWARRFARAIVRERDREGRIATTRVLAETVVRALPRKAPRTRIHPATRVFLALRIAVNRELESLEGFLDDLPAILHPGARCCVLSFHSLEDRIVKERFRAWGTRREESGRVKAGPFPGGGWLRPLHKKVIRPRHEEVLRNPLARSARLRAAEWTSESE